MVGPEIVVQVNYREKNLVCAMQDDVVINIWYNGCSFCVMPWILGLLNYDEVVDEHLEAFVLEKRCENHLTVRVIADVMPMLPGYSLHYEFANPQRNTTSFSTPWVFGSFGTW